MPDDQRTLREGAVAAWGRRGSVELALEVDRAVKALGVAADVPWRKLPEAQRHALLYGRGTDGDGAAPTAAAPEDATARAPRPKRARPAPYEGIVPRLERALESGTLTPPAGTDDGDADDGDGDPGADELGRFVVTRICEACDGRRLRPEALAVKIAGRNVADLGSMPLAGLRRVLSDFAAESLPPRERAVAEPLLRAVVARLGFLIDVGLDYLTLDRSAMTLSGGEGQRIRLATQIGSALVGVLYVLDEPTVGLHARDNERLLEALRRLVDLGNTVLVVEHDREAILRADHVLDLGPGAGVHGGRIVAEGTPAEIIASPTSVTGPYLSGARSVYNPGARKRPDGRFLHVRGARANNLRGIDVDVPVGLLVAVTGVSGSGKSSLVIDTLLPAARRRLYRSNDLPGACEDIAGLEHFDKVVSIDQAPIGRTPRSNPATYTGAFGVLRELFATLPEARARGYKAGRFSFNVKGGRCEACQGDGVLRVEMHFLPDVFVECEACGGKRYGRETLEILYRGMSIADVLALTVDEARTQLEAVPRLRDQLAALSRVGLGYLQLGQPATTLSGGEAQRVKLARELSRKATGRTLYVLDEPTTGLHFQDVELLLEALTGLRDAGNTVVVIEHNLDVVASADWVIDIGPDGGERGGELVAAGPPEEVARCERSHTAAFLSGVLGAVGGPTSPRAAGRLRAAPNGAARSSGPQKAGRRSTKRGA